MSRYLKLLPRLAAWYAVHDPAQTGLFLVLILSATLLPLGRAWLTAPESTPPASFDLHAAAPAPNLNSAEPVVPAAPTVPSVVETPAAPELLPVVLHLPAPEPAPLEPAVPVVLRVPLSHAGESTMIRTWKLAGWPALLVMTATPMLAAEPVEKNGTDIILKKLDDVQKSLEDQLKLVQSDQRNDRLELQKATGELAALKETVGQLRKDIDALKSQSTTRVARSPSTTSGRIRLVNSYPEQMTVIVNDTAFRLHPGEVRTLEGQTAGSFQYQVLGVQIAPQPRLLAANETFTITVFPQLR